VYAVPVTRNAQQQVTAFKQKRLIAHSKRATPGNDHIQLIAVVCALKILPFRFINFDGDVAIIEQFRKEISGSCQISQRVIDWNMGFHLQRVCFFKYLSSHENERIEIRPARLKFFSRFGHTETFF